ncbi:MAG TPA: hypothetical protein VFD52_06340 [Clostridia bacterium]|nr:hypothetical protein [Clostridia bacterium]
MIYDFSEPSIVANSDIPLKVAELFAQEILLRTGKKPQILDNAQNPCICFSLCNKDTLKNKDSYLICQDNNKLSITALSIRGLIFGYSLFLRKTEYHDDKIILIKDISGEYTPDKSIRGHQLGYRPCPNTYDAWDLDDYSRYYRDIMMFGCNTCEHIPNEKGNNEMNSLMKFKPQDLFVQASRVADEYDLDVSVWYPNLKNETDEESVQRRRNLFETSPRIDAFFPPGGDPGEMEAKDFIRRCILISREIKKINPKTQMWPSAQQPHSMPHWGEEFIEALEEMPDEIDGVITGPNRAFPLDELRRRLPAKYPIRLYPDITHNVRCEYPVHFNRDDWHYSLTTALSRESINPRPKEYRAIHRLTRRYIVGSVSYSEGVNDDVNKMVWSDMDFFPNVSLNDTLCDYSRAFFFGVPAQRIADGIYGLEQNWEGDPAENPHIENTLEIFVELAEQYSNLLKNWRFVSLLFRAKCDTFVRRKRVFELGLIEKAKQYLENRDLNSAVSVLKMDLPSECTVLREDIEMHAKELFEQIGLQLDVERYHAKSWERGATLETIDLPITDRQWLNNKLNFAMTLNEKECNQFISRLINRNKVENDEYYFSFAEHGFDDLGVRQDEDFYMNYQGDKPNVNDGNIPMSMLKLYDHFTFKFKTGGFKPNTDYKLRITYSSKKYEILKHFKVEANGNTIYEGKPYGGETNEAFDNEMLAPGFETATYLLPSSIFENGCLDLRISEPIVGLMLSEFWILKA